MNVTISNLSPEEIQRLLPQLVALLQDAVAAGASIGFLPPLAAADATDYWVGVADAVQAGHRVLLVAQPENDPVVQATVQLDLATKPNALHRAEVAKLLVHSSARRQGLGRQLIAAIEEQARQLGRTTLVLDTRHGDVAEQLYQQAGFELVGLIPEYFLNNDGQLHATAVYYKILAAVKP
ncbi:GNAT family N-acetyltransferase [Hymenobacter sp. BT683]|uniref:GNAT family N-acetyltransferase n=1 Tax=Hymenobacter jeongseonensis TaxID=2791027 RepID=A0ABS0IIK0_9BACT|nr:N-acetyltransferase [Hymenobacter jeongseonensis]MBF9238168.1 GNAT family N-acetyltransferase [Hymenobacter jeongseonensis]